MKLSRIAPPPHDWWFATERLLLRATSPDDAERAFQIQSSWNVTRNLSMAAFPPDHGEMTTWFCEHQTEWQDGTAFRFAVLQNGRMIGLVDLDQISDGKGDLGYWFDESCWGRGFALESASVVVRFAFEEVHLNGLRSGHAVDNPASGRVLSKLGFRHTGEVMVRSRSRGASILQRRYRLELQDRSPG